MKSALTGSVKGILVAMVGIAVASCGLSTADTSDPSNDGLGKASQPVEEGIRLSMIGESQEDDVVGFSIVVKQNGVLVDSACVLLEEETLPSGFLPEGSGDGHRFADRFFALAASDDPYQIKVRPVRSCDPPKQSKYCDAAEGEAIVEPGKTTEVTLVSQCKMLDTGGLDIIAALNHAPVILDLVYRPSKFILTCEELAISVSADDQDGDPLTYEWEVDGDPGMSFVTECTSSSCMMFMSKTAGDYTGKVKVCDNYDACTSLMFPIHVQMSSDTDENGLGDECQDTDPTGGSAGAAGSPND